MRTDLDDTDAATGGRVLVVDDHRQARESMADILRHAGHQVRCLSSAMEALKLLERETADAIVSDLQMPGMSGLEFVLELERRQCGAQIVLVTAYATVASAVEAMRHGAFDYIEKPFGADQLEEIVRRALADGRLAETPMTAAGNCPASMIGESPAMLALKARIAQVAPTSETVLIAGESGSGKELVARTIHLASDRRDRPFIPLNCPGLSANLMESELFGHEKGAFTGAETQRTGRFELADGGSLLLDEVTEIELPLQAKLLRVLQERQFERVGSSETRSVDVRVMATTNRDLAEEIAGGRFRADLYYRLAVVPLVVPPLRERRGDIGPLIDHCRRRAAERLRRQPCEFAADAIELMHDYHWPGNVRELENIVTRASVLSGGTAVRADDLRPWLIDGRGPDQAEGLPIGLSLAEMERKLIESTLEHFGGHRERTAEALDIGLRTLSEKLRKYGYAPRARFNKAG